MVYLGCGSIVCGCSQQLFRVFMDIVVFVDGVNICNVFIDVVSCCVVFVNMTGL